MRAARRAGGRTFPARSQGRKEEVSRLAECAPRGEQREKEQDGGKGEEGLEKLPEEVAAAGKRR